MAGLPQTAQSIDQPQKRISNRYANAQRKSTNTHENCTKTLKKSIRKRTIRRSHGFQSIIKLNPLLKTNAKECTTDLQVNPGPSGGGRRLKVGALVAYLESATKGAVRGLGDGSFVVHE